MWDHEQQHLHEGAVSEGRKATPQPACGDLMIASVCIIDLHIEHIL
jgi:hypothetical protein